MNTTPDLPFPDNLPPLPEPPAGHQWKYRGTAWEDSGTSMAALCGPTDSSWIVSQPHDYGGVDIYHYAEVVPVDVKPDYTSRSHQKCVLDAAWEGKECESRVEDSDMWIPQNFHEIARCLRYGGQIRIKPTEPTKKRVPLTPDDIPAVCWVKRNKDTDVTCLVVGVDEEGVCYSQEGVVTFEAMMEEGWEYSEDRRHWKPCYREVIGEQV